MCSRAEVVITDGDWSRWPPVLEGLKLGLCAQRLGRGFSALEGMREMGDLDGGRHMR